METKDILSLAISFMGLLVSMYVVYKSNKAVEEAKKATDEAKKAAEEANKATVEANRIANKPFIPKLSISSMLFDPNQAKLYGGKNVRWPKRYDFIGGQLKLITATKAQDCRVFIPINKDGSKDEYLLVNLCEDESELELVLLTDALIMTFEIEDSSVNQISINAVYSMLTPRKCFGPKLKLKNTDFFVKDNKAIIRFAYANWYQNTPSLKLDSMAEKIAAPEKQKIDLMKMHKADELVNFIETGYLLKCKCANGEEYEYSIIAKRENEKEIRCQIYESRKEFEEAGKKASKRAGMDVVAWRDIDAE